MPKLKGICKTHKQGVRKFGKQGKVLAQFIVISVVVFVQDKKQSIMINKTVSV